MSSIVSEAVKTDSSRISRLKKASRLRGQDQPACPYIRHLSAAHERDADLPWPLRQARARADALEHMPVYLFPDERLVGMVYHCGPTLEVENPTDYRTFGAARVRENLPENRELVELGLCKDGASPGHITWRWDWILQRGVLGLLAEYREALAHPQDETAEDFYRGVVLSLEALLRWNERHLDALREALDVASGNEAERLEEMIALCRRVPANPARTFHEALQSFYFQYLAVMRESPYGGNGPGRLDTFLWPYLERDLETGVTTLAEARELIDEIFIRLHERILPRDTWVETIVVGGSHPDGTSAVNPLSYLAVESIIDLDQTHPAVYIRMPKDPPPDFVELAGRYLLEGKNRAQILSDPAIVAAFSELDVPAEDASTYTCGGCMEITPQGMNSDLLFAGTHNVPKAVELILTGGKCLKTGKRLTAVELLALDLYDSFEALYQAFTAEMERELAVLFKRLDFYSEAMAEHRPIYLMSSMTEDCLSRGRELHDGGSRYHHYGTAPLGIPNAADALYAVKRAVFDDRICTAKELLTALSTNFEDQERLRLRLRKLPKFGQQHPDADAMANRVLTTVCDIYASHRVRSGGRVKPIIFTFVWAPTAGAILGATADGQLAGQPIAQGLTPQAAGLSEGITAAIASHSGLSLHKVAGGASSMWDLDPQWATPEIVENVLMTFLEMGGQIFQGNTTGVEELIRARENPDAYPNLIVRVGGFSARFALLSSELQNDIIGRYRHTG
jgi:formate C-acetyltransferase